MAMNDTPVAALRPVGVLVCALGGEGGGVLAEWLVETALACGHSAQSTSIPGVAQRTGATTYYVEVFPVPDTALGGRRPVFSLNPVSGALDALVSSELLETVRQIGNGLVSPERTLVISSSERTLTTAEKMPLGDGRADSEALIDVVRRYSRDAQLFDMATVTQRSGTVMSAVLFGAIAGACADGGLLPFPRAAFEDIVRRGGKGVDASLRGFAAAFGIVAGARAGRAAVLASAAAAARDIVQAAAAQAPALPAAVAQSFPAAAHDMLALGHARMLEYQDAAYAGLYVERMQRIARAELFADPAGANGHVVTRETARWLALWMAFDDIVRVADLKSSARRAARVRAEVKAGDGEILQVWDHFKPGVPEVAALLPAGLARRLTRWDERRQRAGKPPAALPLKVGTHTVLGLVALRVLASLKWLRVRGSRYAAEQALIERWLGAVEQGTRMHWALGRELAECGRLIKGYGTTNERGRDNLLYLLDHLATGAQFATPETRADAIRAARSAALADDAGRALDRALVAAGAPARPPREQPIRWVRKAPGRAPPTTGAR